MEAMSFSFTLHSVTRDTLFFPTSGGFGRKKYTLHRGIIAWVLAVELTKTV